MSMASQEDEDLKKALKLSLQEYESLERKRSKSRENFGVDREAPPTPEAKNQLTQPELMAAAAEKRFAAGKSVESAMDVDSKGLPDADNGGTPVIELSAIEANKLFSMIFGGKVSKSVLAQWSNQGIRFSADPETSMGLVQHEAGPCGVLSAIQGFVGVEPGVGIATFYSADGDISTAARSTSPAPSSPRTTQNLERGTSPAAR